MNYFSRTYQEAVQKFMKLSKAIKRHKVVETSYSLAGLGAQEEQLVTHISTVSNSTSAQVRKVILLTSGVHGVELFAGSAIQAMLLDKLQDWELPTQTAIVFAHALNPYGSAWVRRTNYYNVDLSRNCVPDFYECLRCYQSDPIIRAAVERYKRLYDFINPKQIRGYDRITTYCHILREGKSALRQTALFGQRDFSEGLFYGGVSLQPELRFFVRALASGLFFQGNDIESVVHLDFHTGLGRYGSALALVDDESSASILKGSGIPVHISGFSKDRLVPGPIVGSLSNIKHFLHLKPSSNFYSLTLEIGTLSEIDVFLALRQENIYHNQVTFGKRQGEVSDMEKYLSHPSKQILLQTFYPMESNWMKSVLEAGTSLFETGLKSPICSI